jgi:hypothetical protein
MCLGPCRRGARRRASQSHPRAPGISLISAQGMDYPYQVRAWSGAGMCTVRGPYRGKPGTAMNPWLICLLAGLALCGCQAAGGPVSDDCPSPNPCDDPGQESWRLPGTIPGRAATLAAWQPLWPGCPSTLQVMARPHPIVFRAVRPDEVVPDRASDPSDWDCELPEEPLLRADGSHPGKDVANR